MDTATRTLVWERVKKRCQEHFSCNGSRHLFCNLTPFLQGEGPDMTAEETRAELLAALAELGRAHPDWRLGQTLSNLAMAAGSLDAGGVWDLEDAEALAAARRILASWTETSAR